MTMSSRIRTGRAVVVVRASRRRIAVVAFAASHFATKPMSAQSPVVTQAAADRGFASSSLHPGVAAFPAALALAEELNASPRDVIAAVVAGY